MTAHNSYVRLGPGEPQTPLIFSVPHAGREYPRELLEAARVGAEALRQLEDRHVDALVAPLAGEGHAVIAATHARAWIDLNRSERELDAAMVMPAPAPHALLSSAKVRGGLGLIPRRLAGAGDIYRAKLSWEAVQSRIREHHRPFHAALAEAIEAARARFGIAILIDCHSMPPLSPSQAPGGETVVVGDRQGTSADPRFPLAVAGACRDHGCAVAFNAPYAGGHILARHGQPPRGVHAIQIEICRSLYLDAALDTPGPGFAAIAAMLASVAQRLEAAALEGSEEPEALAAE